MNLPAKVTATTLKEKLPSTKRSQSAVAAINMFLMPYLSLKKGTNKAGMMVDEYDIARAVVPMPSLTWTLGISAYTAKKPENCKRLPVRYQRYRHREYVLMFEI